MDILFFTSELWMSAMSHENPEWLVCPTNERETLQWPLLFVVIGHLVGRWVTASWPCNNAFFLSETWQSHYSNPGWEKFSISSFQNGWVCVWYLLSHTLFLQDHTVIGKLVKPLEKFYILRHMGKLTRPLVWPQFLLTQYFFVPTL